MIFVVFVVYCLVLAGAEMLEVKMPTYRPPSQEELFNNYFKTEGNNYDAGNKTQKYANDQKFVKSLNNAKTDVPANVSGLKSETNGISDLGPDIFGAVQDYVRTGFFKNYLTAPIEPTTYRYPTAVWSSQTYEKLKNQNQKLRVKPSYKRPVSNHVGRGHNFAWEKGQKRSRGKTKWKDVQSSEKVVDTFEGIDFSKITRTEFVDKFLEQSLTNYLVSSNLKETIGNVSVKTFSEILKNITDEKPKRPQSPYDENKELRMKFREEVILKKKNDTKSQGKFLEKQLQKRLEKVQDVFNEKDKDKILANMWKYVTLNRTADVSEEGKKNQTDNVSTTALSTSTTAKSNGQYLLPTTYAPKIIFNDFEHSTTPKKTSFAGKKHFRGSVKFNISKYSSGHGFREQEPFEDEKGQKNLLKLTAEESSYFPRRGKFPSLTFIGQPEKPSVIPGTPFVDYPVHSFPPATKFKCPKFNDGKPKMLADKETRCQVFYVCTGDGPTTAMLCPNGTMFNENFLVCDWWYNVHC